MNFSVQLKLAFSHKHITLDFIFLVQYQRIVSAGITYSPDCLVSSSHYTRSTEIKKCPKNCLLFSSVKQTVGSAEGQQRWREFITLCLP